MSCSCKFFFRFCEEISENHPGAIVMEDLSKGKLVSITDGLSLPQVISIADSLSSLHAYSLKNKGTATPEIGNDYDLDKKFKPNYDLDWIRFQPVQTGDNQGYQIMKILLEYTA